MRELSRVKSAMGKFPWRLHLAGKKFRIAKLETQSNLIDTQSISVTV
jgi:hypothetical protein